MWILIPLIAVLGLAFGLHTLFPDALQVEQNRMALVYYLV